MIKSITKFGNPVLREKGAEVKAVTPEVQQFCQDLLDTMRMSRGVGLAAPQIGSAIRVFAVDIRGARFSSSVEFIGKAPTGLKNVSAGKRLDGDAVNLLMPMILINPQVELSGDVYSAAEGCLSGTPGEYLKVPRNRVAKVSALDKNGEPVEFICSNFLARVIQHENDHLNGILFTDRVVKQAVTKDKPAQAKPAPIEIA